MSLRNHWPTAEEREFFHREGYLVVPNALSMEQVEALSAAIDQQDRGDGAGFYNRVDILSLHDAFLQLIDNPPVLGKICGFLGWNIWVNHTHYNVRPPDAASDKAYPYQWHQDGGTISTDLQDACPMTAIKVGFYLTDLSRLGRGQTYIVPRSLASDNELSREFTQYAPPPEGAVPLQIAPGTAVLFQQRTFHSQGSPNTSDIVRKSIFVQWAFRWLFPVDTMTLGDLDQRVSDPIRRQLLGLDAQRPAGKLSARYYPGTEDLPLRSLLLKEVGVARLCELGPATARQVTRLLKFDV